MSQMFLRHSSEDVLMAFFVFHHTNKQSPYALSCSRSASTFTVLTSKSQRWRLARRRLRCRHRRFTMSGGPNVSFFFYLFFIDNLYAIRCITIYTHYTMLNFLRAAQQSEQCFYCRCSASISRRNWNILTLDFLPH